MFIYKITNKINGKSYIGQTTRSVQERWTDHCTLTKSKHRSAIREAISKYGKGAFILETIDEALTIEELNEKEVDWILKLETLSPGGYNLDSGGKNKKLHDQTKLKISLSKIGKTRTNSSETRRKISIGNLGKKKSTQHKNALKQAERTTHVKVKCINNGITYRSCSEAARDLGLTATRVNQCARGKRRSAKGFKFEVVNGK